MTTPLTEDDFHLPGYNFVAQSREHKRCGGVGLYIAEDIPFKLRDDLHLSTNNLSECIFVELLSDNVLIGCVYKPPDTDVSTFDC